LLVCVNGMMSRSCFIYDSRDLTTPPVTTGVSIVGSGAATATSFSTKGSFYVGIYVDFLSGSRVNGRIRLSQYIYGDGTGTPVVRSRENEVIFDSFERTMLFGFVKDMYTYFVVVDPGINAGFRLLRVCHVTNCESPCSFGGLYEQTIQCGNRISAIGGDELCGATVVDNFGTVPGPSHNDVCLFNLTSINVNMDLRYDECSMGIGERNPAWRQDAGCRMTDVSQKLYNF